MMITHSGHHFDFVYKVWVCAKKTSSTQHQAMMTFGCLQILPVVDILCMYECVRACLRACLPACVRAIPYWKENVFIGSFAQSNEHIYYLIVFSGDFTKTK